MGIILNNLNELMQEGKEDNCKAYNMENTIKKGDCIELMKELPDKSIDMILCDLPYGTTASKWDKIIPFDEMWKQYERIVKDKSAIVLFASGQFTNKLVNSNEKLYRYKWVWFKRKKGNFVNARIYKLPL